MEAGYNLDVETLRLVMKTLNNVESGVNLDWNSRYYKERSKYVLIQFNYLDILTGKNLRVHSQ